MKKLVCIGAVVVFALGLAMGAFAEKEVKVSLDKVPAKVKEAIQKEVGDAKIKEIEQEGEGEKAVYEVEYVKDGKEVEFCLKADGAIAKDEDEDEEKEEKVTIDQVPAKVKEAIEKQVKDGKIKEIERKGEGDKAIYEVEYKKDGKKAELCFTAEGAPAKNDDDK